MHYVSLFLILQETDEKHETLYVRKMERDHICVRKPLHHLCCLSLSLSQIRWTCWTVYILVLLTTRQQGQRSRVQEVCDWSSVKTKVAPLLFSVSARLNHVSCVVYAVHMLACPHSAPLSLLGSLPCGRVCASSTSITRSCEIAL